MTTEMFHFLFKAVAAADYLLQSNASWIYINYLI